MKKYLNPVGIMRFMDSGFIFEQLFDPKIVTILRLFIKDPSKQYYLREISKLTKTSPASTFRILNKLVNLQVIRLIEIKKTKLYQLENNPIAENLKNALGSEKRAIDYFLEESKKMDSIRQIILVGKEETNKANLILIGENIDSNEIKRISLEIKEKFEFTVTTFSLNEEQYTQMLSMGLYPGTKKIVYKK
jgi:hypothetical protein